MMEYHLAVLPADGIGPETWAAAIPTTEMTEAVCQAPVGRHPLLQNAPHPPNSTHE